MAAGILGDASWAPPLSILVSLGQIYGDVLYYMTAIKEGMARRSRVAKVRRIDCLLIS